MNVKLGGALGAWLLNLATTVAGPDPSHLDHELEGKQDVSKVERMFGAQIWSRMAGKTVVDFGAGFGFEAVSVALHGATKVYGLEIFPEALEAAEKRATTLGVSKICEFIDPFSQPERLERLWETVDAVYTLDSFEHFADPKAMLGLMYRLLKPGGTLFVSFGPPWKHPFGAHLGHFNRMPWIHFTFREKTIFEVRSRYCNDGATRFEEVAQGLNRMTVARFSEIVRDSKFEIVSLYPVAIKKLTPFTNLPLTREYFTSVIQAELVKPSQDPANGPRRVGVTRTSA